MSIISEQSQFVTSLIKQRQDYVNAKTMFNSQYEILSKYFYQTKKSNNQYTPVLTEGEFLNDGSITDNVGAMSAEAMASAIVGAVWKNEKRTFRIIPSKFIPQTKANLEYYTYCNNQITMFMERTKSRFEVSLGEAVREVVVNGTSSMAAQKGDYTTPLRYMSKSVVNLLLGYNEDGDIDTEVIDDFKNAKELFDAYGIGAGPSVIEAYRQKDHKRKFLVSEIIMPRRGSKASAGKLAMPFASYKFMPNEQVLLEEGGYETLPLKVLFYRKLEYESYGRSPAMQALPSTIQANVAAEILAVGGEATAQPPLGVYDNGSLQGKVINLSAAALNTFNYAGSVPTNSPVFPLYSVGDLRVMFDWWKLLHEQIGQYFLLDKLYDLNSNQRMTLGEANIRNAIRSDALAPIFAQVTKFLTDVIERSMDILFSMGLLGVFDPLDAKDDKVVDLLSNGYRPVKIPDDVRGAMLSGLDWYDLDYISPASRTMKNDELQATTMFMSLMAEAGAINQEFTDVIDPDGTATKIKELLSADLIMLRGTDQIAAIRENRQKMQSQMAQLEMERVKSQSNQSNAQAAAARSGAVQNMSGGGLNVA